MALTHNAPFKPVYWEEFTGGHTSCHYCRKNILKGMMTLVCPYQRTKKYRYCSIGCYGASFARQTANRLVLYNERPLSYIQMTKERWEEFYSLFQEKKISLNEAMEFMIELCLVEHVQFYEWLQREVQKERE